MNLVGQSLSGVDAGQEGPISSVEVADCHGRAWKDGLKKVWEHEGSCRQAGPT